MRQGDPDLGVDVHDETRAVEAAWARAAADIGDAEVLHRDAHDAAEAGAGIGLVGIADPEAAVWSAATCASPRTRGMGGRPPWAACWVEIICVIWERTEP